MTRPTRATVDGRAFLDLRARANADRRPVDEYLTLYALEGFLERLSRSPYRDRFVLKGGVLLAAFDERRPTRDVDLAGLHLDNAIETITEAVVEIAAVGVDDGLLIAADQASAEVIREESASYTGVRVSLPASLAGARVSFHVDVNVGDPIEPAPETTAVPRVLGGSIDVLGYSVEMVIAEKLVTAVQRGTANTRWRDFVDLHRIIRSRRLAGAQLVASARLVAEYRIATLAPLGTVLDGYGEVAQARWAAWRTKQKLEDEAPERIDDLIASLVEFAEPILDGTAASLTWDPTSRTWQQ
ncbi:MAG: nucleotidyl transferase AbiEii/AbiGii toxin family protein [Microthrixaceae bacterium]|nr:nucleotidyl transferase AbiEii/AbiGii toxin family protein [Microthrixaceae bacterium]